MKRHYIPVTAGVPGVNGSQIAFIRKVIRTALAAQGVDFPCEVDVLVTNDEEIHRLNREARQVDRATDVLSFPAFELQPGELPGPEDADPGTGLVPLGDMMISLERPRRRSTGIPTGGSWGIWWCTPCSTCWGMTMWMRGL